MKSPFPGMDPYLEKFWGDVHSRLIVYMCDQMNEQLPGGLQARVEESLMVDVEEYSRTVYPDVQVVESPGEPTLPGFIPSDIAVAEPRVIALLDESRTQRHVEIIDRNSGNRVVTVIELISPANNCRDPGRKCYLERQREYLQAGVNLVEIDLIRQGGFVVAVPEECVPTDCRTPYVICVRRAAEWKRAELIPIPLQSPLPNIRIPLRPGDPDVVLRLQPLLDDCYRRGRYSSLDYSRPLNLPFSAFDQDWIDKLLKQ
jgi:hypothetical protein